LVIISELDPDGIVERDKVRTAVLNNLMQPA
jgi:hypothetical protein